MSDYIAKTEINLLFYYKLCGNFNVRQEKRIYVELQKVSYNEQLWTRKELCPQ